MKTISMVMVVFSALMVGGCTPRSVSETSLPTEGITGTSTNTPTVIATPSVDETSVIKTTIKKALVKKHGESANKLNVTVTKVVGNYSQGGASGEGGGGMWFAAKVDNEWKLVWDGNGIILCEDLADYPDFPKTFIPQCYDQKTDKLIER